MYNLQLTIGYQRLIKALWWERQANLVLIELVLYFILPTNMWDGFMVSFYIDLWEPPIFLTETETPQKTKPLRLDWKVSLLSNLLPHTTKYGETFGENGWDDFGWIDHKIFKTEPTKCFSGVFGEFQGFFMIFLFLMFFCQFWSNLRSTCHADRENHFSSSMEHDMLIHLWTRTNITFKTVGSMYVLHGWTYT